MNNKHTLYFLSILMKCGTRLGELAPNDPPITDGCSFTSRLHLCFLTCVYLMRRYTIRDAPLYKFCSFFNIVQKAFNSPPSPPFPSPTPPGLCSFFLTYTKLPPFNNVKNSIETTISFCILPFIGSSNYNISRFLKLV